MKDMGRADSPEAPSGFGPSYMNSLTPTYISAHWSQIL